MSGGAFEYVCCKASNGELTPYAPQIQECAEFLAERGKEEAAAAVYALLAAQREVDRLGEALSDVLYAAEWWASGDRGEESFDRDWEKFPGIGSKALPRDVLDKATAAVREAFALGQAEVAG